MGNTLRPQNPVAIELVECFLVQTQNGGEDVMRILTENRELIGELPLFVLEHEPEGKRLDSVLSKSGMIPFFQETAVLKLWVTVHTVSASLQWGGWNPFRRQKIGGLVFRQIAQIRGEVLFKGLLRFPKFIKAYVWKLGKHATKRRPVVIILDLSLIHI